AFQYPRLLGADSAPPLPSATEVSETTGHEHEAHEYGLPMDRRLVGGTTAMTVALLGLAAFRNIHDFRLTHLPLSAAVVSGILWLAAGQIGFAVSRAWHVSWWTYHVLVFGGFSMILLGVARHVGRGASLSESIMTLFVQDTVAKLEGSYNETLVTMIASVEAKDAYTRGHSARVTVLATLIGEELRLPPEHLRILHHAALLHDVGKIGIPDAILNKPGRLTEEEYAIVKEHPVTGETMLKAVAALGPMLAGVRSHHERWDGRGYPDGLSGEAIPVDGRIIAMADVFDALTSARAYRAAWPFSQAVDEMKRGAGTAFDPRLIAAFLRTLPRYMEQLRRQPRLAREVAVA
ncbi:MAG TPA: HD-GYP domain-containing protein, partial [bacterium]|nr:HD-GYP domain-containing protein [bacterium]